MVSSVTWHAVCAHDGRKPRPWLGRWERVRAVRGLCEQYAPLLGRQHGHLCYACLPDWCCRHCTLAPAAPLYRLQSPTSVHTTHSALNSQNKLTCNPTPVHASAPTHTTTTPPPPRPTPAAQVRLVLVRIRVSRFWSFHILNTILPVCGAQHIHVCRRGQAGACFLSGGSSWPARGHMRGQRGVLTCAWQGGQGRD